MLCFYGVAGLTLALYNWLTIVWDVGSGYNEFNKKASPPFPLAPCLTTGMLRGDRGDTSPDNPTCLRLRTRAHLGRLSERDRGCALLSPLVTPFRLHSATRPTG